MIDKDKANQIMKDLSAAAKEIAKKHGMTNGNFKLSYDNNTIRFTGTMADAAATGGAQIDPTYIRNLARNHSLFGLPSSPGTEFELAGFKHTLVGLKGRRAVVKYPDGRLMLMDPMVISAAIKQAVQKTAA